MTGGSPLQWFAAGSNMKTFRRVAYVLVLTWAFYLIWMTSHEAVSSWATNTFKVEDPATIDLLDKIEGLVRQNFDQPLSTSHFRELGDRVQLLREWVSILDQPSNHWTAESRKNLTLQIERGASTDFPFVRNPNKPDDPTPLASLRNSYRPASKGIVIPTGRGTFRFACHLVSSLRNVLHSTLPIQIVYAGEGDLPVEYRDMIGGLGGKSVEFVDITKILDDKSVKLAEGGWAIKPFAVLASSFEQVILLDADAVFAQAPDIIFNEHEGYQETGTAFFHDRLLWQGAFKERHEWWETALQNHTPSPALRKSKVYNEGYAEEMDSGVVAIDKRRLPVFMGLLHVCWQNSADIRTFTYSMGYGDKESWWFGLELSGANYTFEDHYGGIVGSTEVVDQQPRVCSFTIAHFYPEGKLLWYNGSLLKNKAINKLEFTVPSHWMIDATWHKGATKPDPSCMVDGTVRELSTTTQDVIAANVAAAKEVDQKIDGLVQIQ